MDRTYGTEFRSRAALLGAAMVLLLFSLLCGGVSFSNVPSYWQEIARIAAVGLFVAAMIVLSLHLVGDMRRHRR